MAWVSIKYANSNQGTSCTGVIISPYHVLTSGNCACKPEDKNYKSRTVYTGSAYKTKGGQITEISEVICHEKFAANDPKNDVAILVLKEKLNEATQYVPISQDAPKPHQWGTLAGWGITTRDYMKKLPEESRVAKIEISDKELCENLYKFKSSDEIFCAGGGEVGLGGGDAGAPLIINDQLVGIGLMGFYGSDNTSPDLYLSVPYYKNWIYQYIGEDVSKNDVLGDYKKH